MEFHGREQQRKLLAEMFAADRLQTALIYGRRRVGKSELIKQALREAGKKSIYYECKQTTELNNVDSLAAIISETFAFPKPLFRSMEEVLDFLFNKAAEENLILVLDEYPYLRTSVIGLDSIIQSLIDRYREISHLKFILCGSYVDTMKSLLDSGNPLYGRMDRTIDLKPMDYKESALFYPSFSYEDRVRIYSVFGGIPYYNRLVNDKLSVRENIIELIASPSARLENEVAMYLKSEISRINNANEVFEALAKGYSRFSDILTQSHVSSSPTLVDVLDRLIRMELVRKVAPINDESSKRKTGYHIIDPLSMFYYRYCFRFSSQMHVMAPEAFYDRYICDEFDEWYVPHQFEEVCRQYLIRQNMSGMSVAPFDRIGKYWYDDSRTKTNGEFDLVTEDEHGFVFYEAKFRKEPITQKTVDEEIRQVEATGINCYKYGFISRSGFQSIDRKDLILIDLKQLYE